MLMFYLSYMVNAQVNILQKSGTFARDRANFCQQNFWENFDKNINFMQNCIEDDMVRRNWQNK